MFAELYIYFGIALAGVMSFLSPCVLPLVPPYLCFLGGTSLEKLTANADGTATVSAGASRHVMLTSFLFVLGFTTVFVALGASASFAGQFIQTHKVLLSQLAGGVIVLFGLHFLGVLKIGLFYREARYHAEAKPASPAGAYVVGLAFAFGWTPCIGPILAVILSLAASEASLNTGMLMLLVYSLGLGIPFMLAALAVGPFLGFLAGFKKHLGRVEKVMGALLVLTGVLFITGSINDFGQWLLETFPALLTLEESVIPEGFQQDLIRKGREG